MTLAKWQKPIVDEKGNILTGARIQFRLEVSGAPGANLYTDADGNNSVSNPYTALDGYPALYMTGGAYRVDITHDASGYSLTLRNEPVGTGAQFDAEQLQVAGYAYDWQTATSAPPNAGSALADNVDLSAAAKLYLDADNRNGTDLSTLIEALAPGNKVEHSVIVFFDPISGEEAYWTVDGVTDQGDYYELDVSGHSGATSFDTGMLYMRREIAGADGSDPGISLVWDDDNTDTSPGAGGVKASNDDLSAADELYVSKTDRFSDSVASFLLSFDDSTNPVNKGQILLKDLVSGETAFFTVTGVTDATGYVKIAVTDHEGMTSITDGSAVAIQWSRTGDAGFSPGIRQYFSTATGDADPGAGEWRANHVTLGSVTELYLDDEDRFGTNIEALIQSLDDVVNQTAKAILRFQKVDDPSVWVEFRVTGAVVDGTGYWKIPVSAIDGALPSDEDEMALEWSVSGTDGVAQGAQVAFDDSTTKGDPGPGEFRMDHGTFGSVSELYVDNVDQDSNSITDLLDNLGAVVNANARGYIRFQKVDDASVWMEFAVTGSVVDETGYRTLPVSPVASGDLPSAGDVMAIAHSTSGRDGDNGAISGVRETFTDETNAIGVAQDGKTLIANRGTAIEFDFAAAATLGATWTVLVYNMGAGTLTLDPDGSETINGQASLTLRQGESHLIQSDGSGGLIATLFGGDPLIASENLADLADAATARTNLGVYSISAVDAGLATKLTASDNLSDLTNVGDAQDNLSVYSQAYLDAALGDKVDLAGDTMTGDLTIDKASPTLILNKTGDQHMLIRGRRNGNTRWTLNLGDATTETGSDVGSNISINSHDDSGAYKSTVFSINRSNGVANFAQTPQVVGDDIWHEGNLASPLKADTADQTITGGARVTPLNLGTKSSGTLTVDPGDRPMQRVINGGAFTLAISQEGSLLLDITNNASAGAITTSGFDNVEGSFGTTNGDAYRCLISNINGKKLLMIVELQ